MFSKFGLPFAGPIGAGADASHAGHRGAICTLR